MSGRAYVVTFTNVAVSAVQDLFELTAAANKPCALAALNLGQFSDAGDAQDELLRIEIGRGNTTSGSGGGTFTPVPMDPNDSAAGFTAEINNTTQATGGTRALLHADTFNVRSGYNYIWPFDLRPKFNATSGANALCVALPGAPADSLTCSGSAIIVELG
jgi:hypothetical protein